MKWILMIFTLPTLVFANYRFPNIVEVWRDGKVIYGKFDEIKESEWELSECEQGIREIKYIGKKVPSFLFDNEIFTLDKNRSHKLYYSPQESCQPNNQKYLHFILHYLFNGQDFEFRFNNWGGSINLDILTKNSDRTNIDSFFENSLKDEVQFSKE